MNRPVLIGAGLLLVVVGAVWTLQGLGYLPGSVMSGVTLWAVVGPVVALLGLVLAVRGLSRRGRPPERPRRVTEDVVGYWDAEAARFDEEPDHGLRDPAVRAAWLALLRDHLPEPPVDVLDLGCGTGSLTLLAAELGHRVAGIDIAPAMVAAARTKLASAGASATVELGDAADPPGDAGTYDVVLARHVLWALPDPSAALARWVRLLRPGGRLVLVEGRWWTGVA